VISKVTLPSYKAAIAGWTAELLMQVAQVHAETYPARKAEYGQALTRIIEQGLALSPLAIAEQACSRQIYSTGLNEVFEDVDLIVVPVTPQGVQSLKEAETLEPEATQEFIKYTAPFNFAGVPTVTVPAGFDANGLPIAIQFVAPKLREDLICRAGANFQRLTDWHTRLKTIA
jgi:amidase